MTKIRMYSTIPIATQINEAFAQLARLRLPVLLTAHTISRIRLTSGMIINSCVTNQSDTDIT